jgi:hypothetical protein
LEFDYNTYSLDDLYEVKENIDRELYPERYEVITSLIIEREIKLEKLQPSKVPQEEKNSFGSKLSQTMNFDDYQDVIDNKYNAWLLLRSAILAIFCAYFVNQTFDFYKLILGVVVYVVFVASIKYIFFYCHIFIARKIENQIKSNGVRKK